MAENKFDKDNINIAAEDELPDVCMFWDAEKVYDIKDNREVWWQCPKCGSSISFDSNVEQFCEDLGENQFTTEYSWYCEECGAQGGVFAAVNPLYIVMEQSEDNEDEDED